MHEALNFKDEQLVQKNILYLQYLHQIEAERFWMDSRKTILENGLVPLTFQGLFLLFKNINQTSIGVNELFIIHILWSISTGRKIWATFIQSKH